MDSFLLAVLLGVLHSYAYVNAAPVDGSEKGRCCAEGWQLKPGGGKCYKLFTDGQTWPNAAASCSKENGRLVSVHSAFENQWFLAEVKRVNMDIGAVWLGGRTYAPAPEDTKDWVWQDDASNINQSYMNWNSGEPNNCKSCHNGEDEACLHMLTVNSIGGTWNDNHCETVMPYFCQIIADYNCIPKESS